MIGNAMTKPNLRVKRINHGDVLNVYHGNGYAMVIQIVSMVLMKTQRYIIVQRHNRVAKTCSLVIMVAALIR